MTDLAPARRPEYVFMLPDRRILLITAGPLDADYYGSFHAHLGWLRGDLGRLAITGLVTRMRDGGTTYIPTAEGTLYVPSPFKPSKWPSFGNGPAWRRDLAEYVIEEPEDGPATITPISKARGAMIRAR